VLLFVRLEKEPYVCLGEVAIAESDVTVHPVQFKWELRQWEQLQHRKNFLRILKNA